MPTNSAFDAYFKASAARLAQNRNITPPVSTGYKPYYGDGKPKTTEDSSLGGNLGQGILDFLSTGTYAVAGIGQRVGESFGKLAQGDTSNVGADLLGLVGGMGAVQAATKGIQDKRTWSENLKDLGADEATSTWTGLALDIVLDPAWLIPGGAIAKGITGTARGIGEASRLTKEGVKLTNEVMKGVQATTAGATRPGLRNLPKVTGEYGVLSDVLKPSGQKISVASPQGLQNFYQGIKQANIENYSEWSAKRTANKANYYQFGSFWRKRPEYRAALKANTVVEDIPQSSELFQNIPASGNVLDQTVDAVEKLVTQKAVTPTVTDDIKDAGYLEDAVAATVEKNVVKPVKTKTAKVVEAAPLTGSVYSKSKEVFAPARTEYQKANGFDTTEINYAAIKASKDAPEMARVYDQLVSDPTNPVVISSYKKLVEEAKKQYDYLTKKMGIKIEYIKGDPYNVLKFDANGKPVWKKDENGKNVLDENGKKVQESTPDSRLMMEDVLNNKRLQVRDSTIDFTDYPHPILSIEENNIFRAVHDFFGHAASGRGFAVDGEEAAWVSHSSMFTPEARRAMTTETRGQNSYYNFFDPERKTFAPQKAALFPEEYTLLPAELDLVTGQALTANSFFGRLTNTLSEYSDNVLDELGRVQTPIRGEVLYSPTQITKIKDMVDEFVPTKTFKKGDEPFDGVASMLNDIISKLNSVFPESISQIQKPRDLTTLQLLQQALDTPVDLTSTLQKIAKDAGNPIVTPPAFKPTYWGVKKGKPAFTVEKLTKYFPNDELFTNTKNFGIAMGTTPVAKAKIFARKGETAAQAYTRYQSTIWDDFRTRNADALETVKAEEKAAWNTKYDQPDSEIFTETSAGDLVGAGKLPEGLPASALNGSFNGKPMTTLGKILENVDSMLVKGTLDPSVKNFLKWEFKNLLDNINKKGIKVALRSSEDEINAAASTLLSKGVVKSFADAKIAVSGKADDLHKLSVKPAMKIYVKDRASLRKTSVLGKGQKVPLLERNAAGAPIDKNGKVITEREAMRLQVSNLGKLDTGIMGLRGAPIPQMRMVTETGTDFTGRSGKAGSQWAEQTGLGKQQLAGLQAVRDSIGAINSGIKAKEFIAMPEQAALLSNVMTAIGIKVADNIAPEAIFKQFQKEALPAFNQIVKKIESAAKSEAVIYQARGVFNRSITDNMTLMKAIEATDPGDIQRSVVKFTEDSIALVDDFCAINYATIGGSKLSATEFLQQVAPAISRGTVYGSKGKIING